MSLSQFQFTHLFLTRPGTPRVVMAITLERDWEPRWRCDWAVHCNCSLLLCVTVSCYHCVLCHDAKTEIPCTVNYPQINQSDVRHHTFHTWTVYKNPIREFWALTFSPLFLFPTGIWHGLVQLTHNMDIFCVLQLLSLMTDSTHKNIWLIIKNVASSLKTFQLFCYQITLDTTLDLKTQDAWMRDGRCRGQHEKYSQNSS